MVSSSGSGGNVEQIGDEVYRIRPKRNNLYRVLVIGLDVPDIYSDNLVIAGNEESAKLKVVLKDRWLRDADLDDYYVISFLESCEEEEGVSYGEPYA